MRRDTDKRAAWIAHRVMRGHSYAQIARDLGISKKRPAEICRWFCEKYCELPNSWFGTSWVKDYLAEALTNWAANNPVGMAKKRERRKAARKAAREKAAAPNLYATARRAERRLADTAVFCRRNQYQLIRNVI